LKGETYVKKLVSVTFILSLLVACGGSPRTGTDLVATQIAIEEAAHATMTASVPTATDTPQVEVEKTVQAAIAATITASVPTSAPTFTATATPQPPVLKPLAETTLRRALLGTQDITFDNQYPSGQWQRAEAGNAFVEGNPAIASMIKKMDSVCWQVSDEPGTPKVCDWLYVTETTRQAARLAASLAGEAEDVMAILYGDVSTTSFQEGDQSLQIIEGRGYSGNSGGIVIVSFDESVREIRVFGVPVIAEDLTDLAAIATDKLVAARKNEE
jgi:hypothetical protein